MKKYEISTVTVIPQEDNVPSFEMMVRNGETESKDQLIDRVEEMVSNMGLEEAEVVLDKTETFTLISAKVYE